MEHKYKYITKKDVTYESNGSNTYRKIRGYAKNIIKYYYKDKKCFICGYDKHVEVAHIIAISKFKDNDLISEINSKDNLIYLCRNHHWEYDNNLIKLNGQ